MPQLRFGKSRRLLTPADFKPVFDNTEVRLNSQALLILAKRNSHQDSRIGLVVAKKQIKLANRRNRAKRIIRESFRHQQFDIHTDIVILVRQKADLMDNTELFELLNSQWQRLASKIAKLPALAPRC